MEVTLPTDLTHQVELELASGRFRNTDQLIQEAVRQFLEDRRLNSQRLEALRRIGRAVDDHNLYDRVLIPDQE